MTDPSYRETPDDPEFCSECDFCFECRRLVLCDTHEAPPPLPDWMPTPEELDAMVAPRGWTPAMLLIEGVPRLVRAVRWFLEERENR